MPPKTIIIGGGVAGIAMAHTLKCRLGQDNFEIFDKREGLGGTWRANTYPGCGSDVPIHLYSFSFNLNPDWTQALADQAEILNYIEDTVDKFDLRAHFRFNFECLAAEWVDEQWRVLLVNTRTGQRLVRGCDILLSAVGGFSHPRRIDFPGMDRYKGKIFHTAEWDHSFDWTGKRIAVIGNGCSAAQVIPSIAPDVKKLTQYARSPQWYHPRPNKPFTSFDKFCFRYIPLWQRFHRLDTFLKTDQLASIYGSDADQVEKRLATEDEARRYIYNQSPKKYHDFIVPDFPLGCKRRIYDPGYLACLHRDNVELLPEGIRTLTEAGLISDTGKEENFDAVILATGFKVQSFLDSIKVTGKAGQSLHGQWDKHRGAQAYMGTYVHNFPNFAILFGPNTFPAFNSVIYTIEVQVDYISKTLIEPLLDGYAKTVEVKEQAEEKCIDDLDVVLEQTVFAAGCSNWYINSAGRNSAAWPGLAATYWRATFFPKWNDFSKTGGSSMWLVRKAWRKVSNASSVFLLSLLLLLGAVFVLKADPRTVKQFIGTLLYGVQTLSPVS
ncbi:hypothetical protein GE09DRAFT_1040978 [Coniochaeta sp. 2T2.1]|nr:hypothetical protein GE09DRAFT_1040978 [Coniochaeta sp. 2T2.1]